MATKKDLEARIEALEAEIQLLRVQVVQKPSVIFRDRTVSYPNDWYQPTQIWCGTGTSPAVRATMTIS